MEFYKSLPQAVVSDSKDAGMAQDVSDRSKRSLVGKIIEDTCHEDSDKERREMLDGMKYKVHYIESGEKPKKIPHKRYTKTKRLTAAEKKNLKLFQIDPSEQKYELFEPLHQLWQEYIRDLVNFSGITEANKPDAMLKLIRADYHGALINVSKSKCPSLVGLNGIVVQETKNTFKIVTKEDKLKTIPKENSVFSFQIDGFTGTIYGRQFTLRSAERVHKKFKSKFTIDL